MYRKYFEPEYGEVDKYVKKEMSSVPEMPSMKAWRKRYNYETFTDLSLMIRDCYCYDDLMNVETDDYYMKRGEEDIPVRVYHPQGDGPFPIMLFYHGGGWQMNTLDIYDYVPRYFAAYGSVVVVAVEYRLAPEYKFPVGLEDCYAGLEWAVKNAEMINGSIDSVTVCGDSSGGNFAAAVALMDRDRKGPNLHKQILIFPATTFNVDESLDSIKRYNGGEYFLNTDLDYDIKIYLPNPEKDIYNPYVSPLEETNFDGVVPACFISPECDPLLDHALMYAAKLEDNGVPVEFHLYKGMLHGFINRPYQKSFEALDDIINAIPPITK